MENEPLLPIEIIDLPTKPIKEGISIINENPLGILEKYGKYEFIYDYKVRSFLDNYITPIFGYGQTLQSMNSAPPSMYKEGGSNANMIAPNTIWSGQYFPQPVKVNSEPQVGTFSKGNIVNVLRFDGNNAIIQNPNFLEPAPDAPKGFFGILDLKNQKEFTIPKDYLRKADDNLAVTLSTGILYGANMMSQPIIPILPYKPLPNLNPIGSGTQLGRVLETNVTYTISKPFQFIKSYTNVRPLYELGGAGRLQYEQTANYDILPIGFEVTGDLTKQMIFEKKSFSNFDTPVYPKYAQDALVVKGIGQDGQLVIPVEYLTKKVTTSTSTNSGVVLPVEDNNKNLLMIVGAFLLGYVLFGKDTPTT